LYVFVILVLLAFLILLLITRRKDALKLRMVVGVLLSMAFLLIGMNVQARWLFFLSSLLLASIISSYLVARLSLRGLEVARRLPVEVTEGEAAPVELAVVNRGRMARRLFLLTDRGWNDPGATGAGEEAGGRAEAPVPFTRDVKVFVPRLDAGKGRELRVPRLFSSRGIFPGGKVLLQSGGWVGLASSRRTISLPSGVTVLPRYVELARFPALEERLSGPRMRMDERPAGCGADFYGIREYRQGDPLRHVHWHSSARTGQLMVREFEREPGSLVNVLVLNEREGDAGPRGDTLLDNAARIAASLLRYSTRSGRLSRLAYARGGRLVVHASDSFEAARAELAGLADDGDLSPQELVHLTGDEMPAGARLVVVMPSRLCDLGALANAAPPRVRVGLIMLDAVSFDPGLSPGVLFTREALEGWAQAPPSGFSFFILYRKGDDLRTCLEES
jgi:uncharacterized protein (DUF58 family)